MWAKASKLDLFARLSGNDIQETGGLVVLAVPRWARTDWTNVVGGDRWVVAMWHPPMPRSQWDATIGPAFPYPSQGSYIPVQGAVLPLGDEPDESRTIYAIGRLKIDLSKTVRDREEEAEETLARQRAEMESMTEAWLRNTFTAFYNIPGHKGHTAFGVPGLRDQKETQVETLGS
jgi:hypothetical protein